MFSNVALSELPIQSSTARPRVPTPPLDVTRQISRDWSNSKLKLANEPDRSFSRMWVRIFPILTVPLSDPYPATVDINNISFEGTTAFEVRSLDNGALLGTTNRLNLDFSKASFSLGKRTLPMQKLWIVPGEGQVNTLRWDTGKANESGPVEVGIKLRGQFVIKQTVFESDSNGKPRLFSQQLWSVLNVVKTDDYIRSVTPSEVISTWGVETLKAQAIAARTYGLYEAAEARDRSSPWDVDPTTWFQSYRGVEFWDRIKKAWRQVETAKTSQAVAATDGEILTYRGQVIKAFFSANSGGNTCTVSECFELPDQPYLVQVQDAAKIKEVAGGTWGSKANLTAQSIFERLVAIGIEPPSPVDRLEHLSIGPSGRTWRLRVQLRSGPPIDLDRIQSRRLMSLFGPIRSYSYQLGTIQPDGKQQITGHGYGHGVGLSQWGAQLFAEQGWDAHRILKHYYRGVEVTKL